MKAAVALATVAALAALAGCGAPSHGGQTVSIGAHGFVELDKHLNATESFDWAWKSGAPLRWDLHSHAGGVEVHESGESTGESGRFTAARDGTYSLSWIGTGTATELWVKVDAPYTLR